MRQKTGYYTMTLSALCVIALLALTACGGKTAGTDDEAAKLQETMQQALSDDTAGKDSAAASGSTEGSAASGSAAEKPAATEPAKPAAAPAPTASKQLNEEVVSEDISLTEFPTAKKHSLQEGSRYVVKVTLDTPIQFILYNEARYNAWKSSGEHGTAKINSKTASSCCTADGSWQIDINKGEGGDYYFVFDATKLGDAARPTKAHLSVTKVSTI